MYPLFPLALSLLLQLRERMLQRQQGGYILTVEAGRSLLLSADARAESTLQTELMEIQERWRHAHHRLDQQRRELHGLLKVRIIVYIYSFFLVFFLSWPFIV